MQGSFLDFIPLFICIWTIVYMNMCMIMLILIYSIIRLW